MKILALRHTDIFSNFFKAIKTLAIVFLMCLKVGIKWMINKF